MNNKTLEKIRNLQLKLPSSTDTEWADGYLTGANMVLDVVVDFIEKQDNDRKRHDQNREYHAKANMAFVDHVFKGPQPIKINLGPNT